MKKELEKLVKYQAIEEGGEAQEEAPDTTAKHRRMLKFAMIGNVVLLLLLVASVFTGHQSSTAYGREFPIEDTPPFPIEEMASVPVVPEDLSSLPMMGMPTGEAVKNGAYMGRIQSDGRCVKNGEYMGKVQGDGRCYKNGEYMGKVQGDGRCYKNGVYLGIFKSDGKVYKNGEYMGTVRDMGGDLIAGGGAAILLLLQ